MNVRRISTNSINVSQLVFIYMRKLSSLITRLNCISQSSYFSNSKMYGISSTLNGILNRCNHDSTVETSQKNHQCVTLLL